MAEKTVRVVKSIFHPHYLNLAYGVHPDMVEPVKNADANWIEKWLGVGIEATHGPSGTEVVLYQFRVDRGQLELAVKESMLVSVN